MERATASMGQKLVEILGDYFGGLRRVVAIADGYSK